MITRIIVKFGGSSITFDKKPKYIEELIENPTKFIRYDEINRYAKEVNMAITKRKIQLLIFHGTNQYGHTAVDFLGISPKVRKYCKFLSDNFVEIFRKFLPVEQLDLAKSCKWNEKLKIFEIWDYLKKAREVVNSGGIPISFGTIVNKIPKGYAIISGDDAFLYAGLMMKAKEGIMYMDAQVCNKNPKRYKNVIPLRIIRSHINLRTKVKNSDKTGGIIGKIKKLEILALNGMNCSIVDALKKWNVYKSLIGKRVGTLIKPRL